MSEGEPNNTHLYFTNGGWKELGAPIAQSSSKQITEDAAAITLPNKPPLAGTELGKMLDDEE